MVWGFDDEADDYAEAILDGCLIYRRHVPSLWSLEVANALLVGERRRRITPADSARFLAILAPSRSPSMRRRSPMPGPIPCTWPVHNLS